MTFDELKNNNKHIAFYRVTDKEFGAYGNVLDTDLSELVEQAEKLEMPEKGVIYKASIDVLENTKCFSIVQKELYGEMPIEIGCVWGDNHKLNALEWHKGSEINVAVTPTVLLLGKLQDVSGGKYDSAKAVAFYLEQGEAVEIYATTLHYTPCSASKEGFKTIVVLPKNTNLPLDNPTKIPFLRAKNKWLIGHNENEAVKNSGGTLGIFGDNITINISD